MSDQPDFDHGAWMAEALAHLATRLHHEVALARALAGDRQEGFLGLFLDGDEAERLVAALAGRLRAEAVPVSVTLDARDAALRAHRGGAWAGLAKAFHLAEPELDLILLAAAPALDPRFGRVYGFLNDDLTRRHLTPALAMRLLEHHELDALTWRRMMGDQSPLRLHRLIALEPTKPFLESPIRIDESLLDRLLGQTAPDPDLLLLDASGDPAVAAPEVALIATPAGSGPRHDPGAAAMDLAAGLGLHVGLIQWRGQTAEAVGRTCREAHLEGALPVLVGFDAAPEEARRALLAAVAAPAAILSQAPARWTAAGFAGHLHLAEPLTVGDRHKRLDRLAAAHPDDGPALRGALHRAAHLPILTLAERLTCHAETGGLVTDLRLQAADGLAGLARPADSGFAIDDLVLPRRTLQALQRIADWPEISNRVLDEWGLGPRLGKSRSLTALFKGPSGTGKTMAAGAVAEALGLPLFRVDLAGMISKYIGETEKNLDRLFAAAEQADLVLFFDEADAVFGQRSEVSDSHDRYANLEVSYLLQRLEEFEGVSILATNLAQNIDAAFLRRIDLVVEFPAPGVADRAALWKRGAAQTVPVGVLDFDRLARFELTGGEIRNCWLMAAGEAARHGGVVDMARLMAAVWVELVKQGRPVSKGAFGEYYTAIRTEMGG